MRVTISDSQVSFMRGGAEMLAIHLEQAIMGLGHDVEIVRFPINPNQPADLQRVIDFTTAEDLTRWIAAPDVVIPLRFPGWLVQHPDRRVFILHQLRQYYEVFSNTGDEAEQKAKSEVRERIVAADTAALGSASKLWALSGRVAERLEQNNGITAPPRLYVPPPGEADLYHGKYEMYIFVPSRQEKHKRQHLLIEAMRYVTNDVKAVIVGDGGAFHDNARLIDDYGLRERILHATWQTKQVMAAWYANCLAVFFAPQDEDYGFITLEAMLSGKPVITATDSGGPLEFVDDGENGYVVEPSAHMIAEKINHLAGRVRQAREMGMRGYDKYRAMELSWEKVAQTILS